MYYHQSQQYCNHSSWSSKNICYFCNTNSRWKDITLADGCDVPACGICFASITKDKKLAEERGNYDPSKIARIIAKGGDRMKIPRGETSGDNIKVDFVEERGITTLEILNEGELDTYTPKEDSGDKPTTRLLVEISYDDQKPTDPKHWRMNNKSRNSLIDIFGDDTEKWIGKKIEISLTGDDKYRNISVDILRTKKDQ